MQKSQHGVEAAIASRQLNSTVHVGCSQMDRDYVNFLHFSARAQPAASRTRVDARLREQTNLSPRYPKIGRIVRHRFVVGTLLEPVSYTHLTLPTSDLV